MHNITLTITVPYALTSSVHAYVARTATLEILSDETYGTARSATITSFVIIGSGEEIAKAHECLGKLVYDYNNRPIVPKPTFWQRLFKIYT